MSKVWLLVPLLLAACAHPGVSAPGLPLTRVVVYRNGVGYFERSGRVDGDEVVFNVRPSHVGDFLATLAVMEKGGSSVKSVSFPLHKDDEARVPPDSPAGKPHSRMEVVRIGLDGSRHDLAIGYVAEQPIWKPPYRLVLKEDGPEIQGWGIVQNLSGEDWSSVTMSLVAGAPIAFQSTLGTAVIPARPVVSDTGEYITAVPRSEIALAPPPSAAPSMAAPMPPAAHRARPSRAAAMEPEVAYDEPAPPPMNPSGPRNLANLAATSTVTGATRYDLPNPVSVPNDSATMVLFMEKKVTGNSVFFFAPDYGVPDSAKHPFRVVRFRNDTGGLLERGPIAVFETGAFLGQGVLEPMSTGAEATVPFALDRSLAIDQERKQDTRDARLAHVEAGQLSLERDSQLRTIYRIQNGSPKEAKVVIKHPRNTAMKLKNPPAGTVDNVGEGNAMVPADVPLGKPTEVTVDERQSFRTGADWMSPEADGAVKAYLADRRADPKVADALKKAWEIRQKLEDALKDREKLQGELRIRQGESAEIRESLKSLGKARGAADLLKRYGDRLDDLDKKLIDLQNRLANIELSIGEQQIRFRDAVRAIKLDDPLPAQ